MARRTRVERNTKETQISVDLELDGTGKRSIDTPLPFLTHMLDAFARHGVFDLAIQAAGDIEIDGHHTVEDIGLVLGNAFEQALGDRAGIVRYGSATLPMDEVLVTVAVDFCGRPAFVWKVPGPRRQVDRHVRLRAREGVLRGVRDAGSVQPARQRALRRQRAPHDRVHLQGVRPRVRCGHAHRSAPGGCDSVDQGYADGVIAILDVCSGNLRSVERALAHVGGEVVVTRDPDVVRRADKLVVPGQGAFGVFMRGLVERGLGDVLRERIAAGTPYLGICLGLQVLFEHSEEGDCAGLGILRGKVDAPRARRSAAQDPAHGLEPRARAPEPVRGLDDGAYVYFVHSYRVVPADRAVIALEAEHGVQFCAAIQHGQPVRLSVPSREEPGGRPAHAARVRGGA